MTGEQSFRQINLNALHKLAQLFQKEVSSLIDLYLKDSEKLMQKLKSHFNNHDLKHITNTARELRKSSLDVGATQFSFVMLGVEIAASEHRIIDWDPTINSIERSYHHVVDELSTMRFAATNSL